MKMLRIINKILVQICCWSISFYQCFLKAILLTIIPSLRWCRFQPSCSCYCKQALLEYGIIRGLLLSIWRLLRCHPFGGCGYDPVKKKN